VVSFFLPIERGFSVLLTHRGRSSQFCKHFNDGFQNFPYFHRISPISKLFHLKLLDINVYLIFSITVFPNIFRFGKYLTSYSSNAYRNAYRPLCEVSVIFVRFKTKLEWVDKLYETPQYQISWKSVERFSINFMLTDGRTDVDNYSALLRVANTPQNERVFRFSPASHLRVTGSVES
jgi:hypothetical protein